MSRLAPQFANIMVEFETDNREMAVDVPDSFIGVSKTPPKYPPPRRRDVEGSPIPSSRNHIRIEKDGRLIVDSSSTLTPSQSLRIKKYSEELKRRNRKNDEDKAFFRQSLRLSSKMKELKESEPNHKTGSLNNGFKIYESGLNSKIHFGGLESIVERIKKNNSMLELSPVLSSLLVNPDFRQSVAIYNKVCSLNSSSSSVVISSSSELFELSENVIILLSSSEFAFDPLASQLSFLLTSLGNLFKTHDKILRLLKIFDKEPKMDSESSELLSRLSQYSEPNIRVVKIEKTNEPLGATVKNENGDSVIIGRIIRGGVAERCGLLKEGDEILEVNEIELRGKNVNDVCDILSKLSGTLTLLVVPSSSHNSNSSSPLSSSSTSTVIHIRAHIDYDPEEDPYVPCRELGISFSKGDILHVINQADPHWWQAFRDGEDDHSLPGLIPSSSFTITRESMKLSIAAAAASAASESSTYSSASLLHSGTGFLCAKKSGRKKRRGKPQLFPDDDVSEDGVREPPSPYEEVVLYYPRADRKRPVVLIGPPNIGRHELRQRLMSDSSRFSAALPHTSRVQRSDETDGQDYHFISRLQFEADILARKFVEHGEYEKSYYGTSLEAIRRVVSSGKICVLNLHPQSLKILKASDLMPFVVFVAPPSLEKLKRIKSESCEIPLNDDELRDNIGQAREMEEFYGNYFDMVLNYSDPERSYRQLLTEINSIEREPQWVPLSWQKHF